MDWINEPEEGVAPACGNCFFYAHGGCTKRCPNQSCTFRFYGAEMNWLSTAKGGE